MDLGQNLPLITSLTHKFPVLEERNQKLETVVGGTLRTREDPLPSTFSTLRNLLSFPGPKTLLALQAQLGRYPLLVLYTDTLTKQTLLHYACLEAYSEAVKHLLGASSDPNSRDLKGFTPLHALVDDGCRCESCTENKLECIKDLISFGADPDIQDLSGNSPLTYCCKKLNPKCAETLLDLGASLSLGEEDDIAVQLAEYLPDVLVSELDKCVQPSTEDSLKLSVDFRLLLQIPEDATNTNRMGLPPPETSLLQSLLKAKTNPEPVLRHPVVEAFIHFKWGRVRLWFFLLRLVYFPLLLLYTFLLFRIYSNSYIQDYHSGGTGSLCPITELESTSALILYFVVGVIALTESYKMYTNHVLYFSEGSVGLLWWGLCLGWSATLIPVFGPPPLYYHFPIASASLIYSWFMILVQLGRIPWFAAKVGILLKVVKDFLLLLVTFLALLVGFALGFCLMLPENPHFSAFLPSLFKTFLMMKGDIDTEGILDRNGNPFLAFPEYSIPVHLIYASFVLVVTMLLTALLIGLAVKDIEESERKAHLNRTIRLIKELAIFEATIRHPVLSCGLTRRLCRWFSIERSKLIKNFHLEFSPLHPDDASLPEDIKAGFLPFLMERKRVHCQHRRAKGRKM